MGVGGGADAAVHTLGFFIGSNADREGLCCVKVDFRNAFNECYREAFLSRLNDDLFTCVQWLYHAAGELCFGKGRILSTARAQQDDPLGPLLFLLVVLQCLNSVGSHHGLNLQLWYL